VGSTMTLTLLGCAHSAHYGLAFGTTPPLRVEPASDALAQEITEAQPAAQQALADMASPGVPGRVQLLGFRSTEEAKSCVLGGALAVYYVPLDELKSYTGGDPKALLYGGTELLFPVMAEKEVRSSLTVQKLNSSWQTARLGQPTLAKMLVNARSADARKLNSPTTSYFEVFVPALNLRFIGHLQGAKFYLIPMRSDPTLGLRAGTAYVAEGVFLRLVPVAKANNGQPT